MPILTGLNGSTPTSTRSSDQRGAATYETDPAVGPVNEPEFSDLSTAPADIQSALVRAFIRASDTLTDDYDLESSIANLIEVCLQLTPGAEASVVLADEHGDLSLAGSSSERKRLLEQHQIDRKSGPSIESYESGAANSYDLVRTDSFPWPEFARLARAVGFRITRSIPLRLRDDTIGVLSIADKSAGTRPAVQDALLQALADTTTIGFLNRRTYSASSRLNHQLQTALNTRVLIEQSKGVVAARLGLTVDQAFEMLRSYARSSNRKLIDVASSLLEGTLTTYELTCWKASIGKTPKPMIEKCQPSSSATFRPLRTAVTGDREIRSA